jgi:VWFA-related protein
MTSHYFRCIAAGFAAFLVIGGNFPLKAQATTRLRVEKGTRIVLDLETPVNSGSTREGDTVLLRARSDVKVHDHIAIPKGAPVKATAVRVTPAFVNGKSQHAEIRIRLDEILLIDGSALHMKAADVVLKSEASGRSTASGILQAGPNAAVVGGLLGGLIGGSSRAAGIGSVAAIGIGAIGTAKNQGVKGANVILPQDAIVEFRLEQPLDIADPSLIALSRTSSSPFRAVTAVAAIAALAPIDNPSIPDRRDSIVATPVIPGVTDNLPVQTERETVETSSGLTLSVDVKRVLVDATVRDRYGSPVTTLRKEDFRLFADGIERPIQEFSRDELPLAVALLVDRSGSVGPLMNRIQSAAAQALQQLKAGDEVCLVSFAERPELLVELTTDRDRIANRIGYIRAGGGTGIVDAVNEALAYLSKAAPDRRRAVILISDNQEGRSYTPMDQVIRLASETDAVVYSVKIGVQPPPGWTPGILAPGFPTPAMAVDPVPAITRETGGEIFATNAASLDGALATAIARLKLRYTLSFIPDSSSTRAYHQIEVRLADRFGRSGSDYIVYSRSGYF